MKVQNNLFDPRIAVPKHHLSFTRSTLRSEQTHPIPSLSQMLKKQRWCTVRFHKVRSGCFLSLALALLFPEAGNTC